MELVFGYRYKKTQVNTTIDHVKNKDDQNRKGRNTTSDGPTLLIKGLIKENQFKRRREVLVFYRDGPTCHMCYISCFTCLM